MELVFRILEGVVGFGCIILICLYITFIIHFMGIEDYGGLFLLVALGTALALLGLILSYAEREK